MYDRRLNDRVLSFGHAGILYKNSFVMYDRQTESLWVHVTGKAEVGAMKGQQLTFMPSTVTTWKAWKAAHPNSLVLPGYRRGGFMGTYGGVRSIRGFGLVVFDGFQAKLYPVKRLKDGETGSLWSAMTGTAVMGALKGQQLEQLSHYPILTKRFHAFYPEGPVFQ